MNSIREVATIVSDIASASSEQATGIEQINKALNQVLADKEVQKRIEEHGANVRTSTPAELGALVRSELAKWKTVVQRAKLTALS